MEFHEDIVIRPAGGRGDLVPGSEEFGNLQDICKETAEPCRAVDQSTLLEV